MTEKRFVLKDESFKSITTGIIDNDCDYFILNSRTVLDLLNAFYEENQALKRADSITDLETQIMHLKQENQGLHRKVEAMSKELCNCEEDYIMEEYL